MAHLSSTISRNRSMVRLITSIPLKVFARMKRRWVRSANKLDAWVRFYHDLQTLKGQLGPDNALFPFGKLYPCLNDRFSESGTGKGAYFHQDLLVARRVHSNQPTVHLDVGSRVDGFVAHVASFRPIQVIDVRPLSNNIANVTFFQMDLMGEIAGQWIGCCDSLSCLHALEHFGLGRYGDAVLWNGHLIGLENLRKLLKRDGKLYFSVPIGPQRIEFNAHRVFCLDYLLELFHGKFAIDHFSFVDDEGDLHEDVDLTDQGVETNFGCTYGCGIFELTKL